MQMFHCKRFQYARFSSPLGSSLSLPAQAVCHQYWPGADLERYGEYAVSVAEEERVHDGFLERVFTVTDSKVGHCIAYFIVTMAAQL